MSDMMEKIIKEKFDNFEVAPSAGLFNAIQAKRKRKKRVIWIWSAASILLISTAYFGLNSLNNTTNNQEPVAKQESIIKTDEVDNKNLDEKVDINALNNLDINDAESNTLLNKKQHNLVPNVVNNSSSFGQQKEEESTSIANQNLAEKFKRIVNSEKNNDITKAKFFVKDKELVVDALRNKSNANLAEKFKEIVKSEKNNDISKAKFFVKDKEIVVDAQRNSNPDLLNLEPKASPNDNNVDLKDPADVNKNDNKYPNDDDLVGSNPKLTKWSMMLTAGPGIGGRMLRGDQNTIDSRNAAESSKLSFGFDLRTSYAFSGLWNIQTGVNYVQRMENFNHVVNSMEVTSHQETKEITIIHPVLGEIKKEVEYTVMDTTITSKSDVANNTYTSISIPLSVERMFPIGQKFAVLARTGLQFGINQSASGLTINQENQSTSISTLPYKQSGVNRIELGVGAIYRVNDRLSVLLYPQGNVALQSVYKKSAFIEQRDFGLYTHLGIKIDL